MKLNLNIVEAAGMVCQDMGAATATRGLGQDYELMYQDAWGFQYNDELEFCSLNPKEYELFYGYSKKQQKAVCEKYKNALGRKVSGGQNRQEKWLSFYHGVETQHKKFNTQELYLEGIKKQLAKGIPVEMWFDQYFMPWTKEVRKKAPLRYQGYMMIHGFDEETGDFHCIDIHGTRTEEVMPMRNFLAFLKEHQRYCFTTYRPTGEQNPFQVKRFLEKTLQRIEGIGNKSIFNEMRRLADDIEKKFDFQEEIALSQESKGSLAAPTHILCVKSFTEVSRMRNLFALTLTYIGERENMPEILKLSERFRLHAAKWQILVAILGKAYFKKDFNGLDKQLSEHIRRLADEEEETKEILKQLLDESRIEKVKHLNENEEKKQKEIGNGEEKNDYVFCDLVSLFNNRAFAATLKNAEKADFDGLGNYLLRDMQKGKQMIFCGEQPFQLGKEGEDNICCTNQIVSIQPDEYYSLNILGACDSGAFYGKLEISYLDGEKQESIFGFGEWRFGKCEFGEKLAWQGERVYWNQVNAEEKGYLFWKRIPLNRQKKLCQIKLPDCKNMHVFSITLNKLCEV